MNTFRVKFNCGPTQVERFAIKAAASDRCDPSTVLLGTEHVYFTVEGRDVIDAMILAQQILGEKSGITIEPRVTGVCHGTSH